MKKKAAARKATTASRQPSLSFPAASEAELIAESAAVETSTKSDGKNRRKLTADFADDADKGNKSNCDSSAISAQSAVKTQARASSVTNRKNRTADFADDADKDNKSNCDSSAQSAQSAVKTQARASSVTNRKNRTADFADDADKGTKSHCDSSAISAPSAVKTDTSAGRETKTVADSDGTKDSMWPIAPLGQIAEVKLGKMLDKTKHHTGRKFPYLRNVNVRWGSVETHDVFEMYFEDEQVERFSLETGDVVVCEGGEPGRAAVWNGQVPEMKFQKAIHRVRFKIPFEPRLLVYFLEWLARSGRLERRFTGSTIKHFTREAFIQLPIPCPPISEQRRIVAEIEKQFTRLDAGVAALKRVQANLKRYRAAVLKAACEGRLVPTEAELRKDEGRRMNDEKKRAKPGGSTSSFIPHPSSFESGEALLARILTERRQNWQGRGKYKEPAALDTTNLPAIPDGWTWATLEQLLIYLRNGWGLKPTAESGVPILRISAVRPMSVKLADVRYLSGPITDYADYILNEGDLLFTRYNGNPHLTGVCGVVPPLTRDVVHPDKLIRVKLVPKLCLPKFVGMVANVGASRDFLASRSRTSAGQTGISGSDVRGVPILLPPLAEQTRIVAEVERRLSVVEELEAVVSANLQRATRLRQSILQKAFTGELV